MYRTAAFDMDGTLLMPDHRVGPETLAVLNQLVEREMVVTFATGRHYLDAQPIMAQLGLQGYLITGNGTRVYDNRANSCTPPICQRRSPKRCCIIIGAPAPACTCSAMKVG